MKSPVFVLAAVAVAGCSSVDVAPAPAAASANAKAAECAPAARIVPKRPASPSLRTSALPYKLGVARYTMHAHPFESSLQILQDIDCHYLGLIEDSIKYDATDAEIAAYKEKCASYGVEVVSAGPLYFCKEEDLKACCEFAKRYGMKYISVVPYEVKPGKKDEWGVNRLESDAMIDLMEKYAKQYDIRMAIHNHGPDSPTLFPTGEVALKHLVGRDKRLGVCIDVGHERRAGMDPVAFIRKNPERIFEVHLKNIKIDPVKNIAKEGPRGELDILGILTALAEVGFDGYCLVEFEKDFKVNAMPLAESFGYYRGVMDSIKVPPKMQPVPPGANALTAEEKQDGYELLFDGKRLPADKWVGAAKEWDLKKFPERGWFVRDGALAMRPQGGVSPDGSWFPLPPEDKRLGGGGDIVTKKKYRDFIFKFDFRLMKAGNSGIKYFYNEGCHQNSTLEYQILDPGHPDYDRPNPKGVQHVHRIAALYDLIPTPLADAALKPAGQWNSGMIVSKGKRVEHWLNGVKVLEFERGSKEFRDAVAKSKYLAWQDKDAFWGEAESGRLLIQDHTDSTVSFCNLKVKEL